ncbi:MAG: uroporphyrinogen-III synthase [Chitinophagaceae bacterium]
MIFGKNKVIAEGVTSHELAQNIIKLPMEFEKIVFFSGSRRKDDLPGIIKSRYPDKWMEIKVYATKSKPIELKNSYEGIAFCSPSAVDALLEKNDFTDGTKIFAIGSSTANLLSAKGIKDLIISSVPDKNKMLEDIVNYFK